MDTTPYFNTYLYHKNYIYFSLERKHFIFILPKSENLKNLAVLEWQVADSSYALRQSALADQPTALFPFCARSKYPQGRSKMTSFVKRDATEGS